MANVYQLIRQAILEKKQIRAMYDSLYREICPHVLGLKNGVRHVLSFQFAGESSKGLPPGGEWKCMDIDGLQILSIEDGPWHTGTRKTGKPQTCVDQVDVAVAF